MRATPEGNLMNTMISIPAVVADIASPFAQAIPLITPLLNPATIILMAVVLALLAIAFGFGQVLARQPDTSIHPAVVRRFNSRVRAWWMMCATVSLAFLFGRNATLILFGVVSFWALREFITLTPTRLGDHRALFWVFFAFTPLQYVLVWLGPENYGLYSIVIPVYGFLFVPARVAISGDYKRFLERTAKIQAGMLVCVYTLSFAPALLDLQLRTNKTADGSWQPWEDGSTAGLLFYLILIAQSGDVLQFLWGQLLGRRVIAPTINASRTWEGFFGGIASTTLIGTILWWVTPFTYWQSACMSLVIAVMGFAGSMTMSAIKRDRGVRDYGTLVEGHAGVLDRIDSICFAAPVFFHLTRFFFADV
jgi:phosphatidate cytidylyltransferase